MKPVWGLVSIRKAMQMAKNNDWRLWRECEEKVMKYDKENDTHLLTDLMKGTATKRTLKVGDEGDHLRYFGYIAFDYIKSDLPTRCKAFVKVLTSET